MKYKYIKIGTKEYSDDHQIETLLSKKGIFWLIDCEFEDAEIEINRNKVVWKNGSWYNGVWEGVCWEDGVWFNGVWKDGTFKGGIFHNGVWENGVFEKGSFINGEVKGGIFKNYNKIQQNNDQS